MLEFFQWALGGFWRFVGVVVLLYAFAECAAYVVRAARKSS